VILLDFTWIQELCLLAKQNLAVIFFNQPVIKIINIEKKLPVQQIIITGQVSLAIIETRAGLLASSSSNGIQLWNYTSGHFVKNITEPKHYILARLNDGNFISCSTIEMRIWNSDFKLLKAFNIYNYYAIKSLVQLNQAYLAVANHNWDIIILNVNNGGVLNTLLPSSNALTVVISLTNVSPSWLASASYDRTIKIWNFETDEQVNDLTGHECKVNTLLLLQNGHLASGSCDNTIRI
jgi:WD40 repeat protein